MRNPKEEAPRISTRSRVIVFPTGIGGEKADEISFGIRGAGLYFLSAPFRHYSHRPEGLVVTMGLANCSSVRRWSTVAALRAKPRCDPGWTYREISSRPVLASADPRDWVG